MGNVWLDTALGLAGLGLLLAGFFFVLALLGGDAQTTDPEDEVGAHDHSDPKAHYREVMPEAGERAQTEALGHPIGLVPHQLPAASGHFVGREHELARLSKIVGDNPESTAITVISAISGAGGIGKTWLALHWAHLNIAKFTDGQLYVNLRGFYPSDNPVEPATALHDLLEALGVASAAIPVGLDSKAALYRSLLASKRMLIILDNARDSAQVIPLLPASRSCVVLITSRQHLLGLVTSHSARSVSLDILPEAESRELLTRHVGADRINAEPEAIVSILQSCGGLPLALSIAAARTNVHHGFLLAVVAEELRVESTRLDALDSGEVPANLPRGILLFLFCPRSHCSAGIRPSWFGSWTRH